MSSNQDESGPELTKAEKSVVLKKETFQWSTPADEFADDVESDNENEDVSYMDEVHHAVIAMQYTFIIHW